MISRYLDEPQIPDVDLFVRSSGEQRTSNFLLWQSAYAEMVFLDTLFPDFDRRHLWHACEIYASRDRRYGGAEPNPPPPPPAERSASPVRPAARTRPSVRWPGPQRAPRPPDRLAQATKPSGRISSASAAAVSGSAAWQSGRERAAVHRLPLPPLPGRRG